MKKEIIVGAVAALLASLITWFSVQFTETLSKLEIQKIATEIKNDNNFHKVLINEFLMDSRFKGKDGRGVGSVVKNGINSCMEIGESEQICWGSEKLEYPLNTPHIRNFHFKFASKFSGKPIITTGIHANNTDPADVFGVYSYTLNKDTYSGGIIAVDGRESPSPVVMQYFAIGSK